MKEIVLINSLLLVGVLSQMGVVSSRCHAQLVNYMSENGPHYPWLIGGGVIVPEKTSITLLGKSV